MGDKGRLQNFMAGYAGKRRSGASFVPAPMKGWNSLDPQGLMSEEYALLMENFLPMENGLTTRGGSKPWCSVTGTVEALMEYNGGIDRFAVAGGVVWELPAAEGETATSSRSGLSSSKVQYTQMGTSGGDFLWCCNGEDAPFYWNGTEWTTTAITVGENMSLDPTDIINVAVYQSRLFLCEKSSLTLWYLGINALTGVANPLFMGAYCTRGGYLVAAASLTIDGGYGPDDYLFVVTSEGEALVFKGKDPASASDWQMVGRFQFSRPMGYRCLQKFGADLLVITESGVAGVSSMLSAELAGLKSANTEKIQPSWAAQAAQYKNSWGWQACVYHLRGLLLVNMPDGRSFKQWVLNLQTEAWSTLSGWERARCLMESGGQIWAGYDGCVQVLDTGLQDVDESGVKAAVTATVQQAFIFPGKKGTHKRYTLLRPYIVCANDLQLGIAIATDSVRNPSVIRRVISFAAWSNASAARWNTATWDIGSWGIRVADELALRTRWVNVVGHGYSMSVLIEVSSTTSLVVFTGCDIQYEMGNAL